MAETNILNLPTYEQVEEAKQVTIATGGRIIDILDKTYKTIMDDTQDFKIGMGKDNLQPLQDDYVAKFPAVASKYNLLTSLKVHLWDNIFMVQGSKFVIFFDLNTLTVINAEEINYGNFSYVGYGDWFADAKYLYVRGRSLGNAEFTLGVYDKTTLQYVTAIKASGGNYIPAHDWSLAGNMECIGSTFFLAPSGDTKLMAYLIAYTPGGVPTGFTNTNVSIIGTGVNPKTIMSDGEFLYDIHVTSSTSWYVYKKKYDPISKHFSVVAGNVITSSAPGPVSKWSKIYYRNGRKYAVIAFGQNGVVLVLNLDALILDTTLFSLSSQMYPLFDYVTEDRIVLQNHSVGSNGLEIGGSPYEPIWDLRLGEMGKWTSQIFYVPATKTVGGNTMGRLYELGNYAVIREGKILLKNGRNNYAELTDMSIIKGYKEVFE